MKHIWVFLSITSFIFPFVNGTKINGKVKIEETNDSYDYYGNQESKLKLDSSFYNNLEDDTSSEEQDLIKRAIPGDETTGMSDAIQINTGTQYSYIFNTKSDSDYYYTSQALSAGSYITISMSVSNSSVTIYKYTSGSDYSLYMTLNSFTSTQKFYIEETSKYAFVFKSNSYMGAYKFTISNYSIGSSDIDKYIVHTNYLPSNIKYIELIYRNYSNYSNSGTKAGAISKKNNIDTTIDYEGNGVKISNSDEHYYGWLPFSGLFNGTSVISTNVASSNINAVSYDDRYTVYTDYYPGNCICKTDVSYGSSVKSGTSFYVDDDYLMSAAHMLYSDTGSVILNRNIEIYQEYRSTGFNGSYYISDSYMLYSYAYGRIMNNVTREHDWCIFKLGDQITSETDGFTHGYLGLKYSSATSYNTKTYGYPHRYMLNYSNNWQYAIEDVDKLAVSSGNIAYSSGYFGTYQDISAGMSGGPTLVVENNMPYVLGIVSGNSTSPAYNVLSSINKYNFNLLNDLITGVV